MRITFLFCLLPLMHQAQAANAGTDLGSRIISAKVFRQGAQVVRKASMPVPAGASTIVLTGLAQGLDPQSIQLTGEGGFTILSVQHRMNYLSESPRKKELDELATRMEKLDRELAMERAMQEVWANEEQLLLKNSSVGGQQNGVTAPQLAAVNDYIRDRLRTVKTNVLAQQEKITGLQKEKARLQQQMNELQGLAARPTSEVVVEVQSKAATNCTLTLDYYVPQAGWSPAYDVRAKSTGQPIELVMKAQVTNQTGEDWNKVDLALSSGDPAQSGTMPNLRPWTLHPLRPAREYTGAPMQRAENLAVTEASSEAMAKYGPHVTLLQQATTVEYAVDMPFSVPSDANPHTIVVQQHNMPAAYRHYATPKLDKDAYLYARTTGWEDLRLLSGEANIFFEGTFVGKTQLRLDAANDTIDISLGRDKGVVVERVKRKSTDQKAFLGNSRTVAIAWDITVRNNKNTAVELELRDQYPLSPQSEIEVKLTDQGGASVDAQQGLLSWTLGIAPKRMKKLGFAYTVKHPKEMPVALE